MIVHDLSPEAVHQMVPVDLAGRTSEPDSPIAQFPFHGCTCGIGCYSGTPPWERHTGDELLSILAGQSLFTVIEDGGPVERTLTSGDLVVVPGGRWHRNRAPDGVTMLYITPTVGSQHSWTEPE